MIWSQMDESIVENWLRSLGMVQYTQAFIDNGYDDLEICKQIGDEDLDAIGVTKEAHRKEILEAVSVLLKYGGARVYFTLDPEYQRLKALQAEREKLNSESTTNHNGSTSKGIVDGIEETSFMNEPVSLRGNGDCMHLQSLNGISKLHNSHPDIPPLPSIVDRPPLQIPCGPNSKSNAQLNENGTTSSKRSSLVTFSKLHLTAVIQDKLTEDGINLAEYGGSEHLVAVIQGKLSEDGIDLAGYGYCERNNESSENPYDKLARKYASELHTHQQDVFQVLMELKRISSTNCDTPSPMEDREWIQNSFSLFSVNGQCHRSIPPPLPPRPPPSNIYEDPLELDASLKASPAHSSRSPLLPQQRLEEMSECQISEDDTIMKRRSLTLGRLLRGGFKKQPKKYVYKQYKGDLSASEITMPDEERIELMIRVKEGKMSMHDAVERVKQYEEEKKGMTLQTTLSNGNGHI